MTQKIQTDPQPVYIRKAHRETIQINVDDENVAESSPQNGIPTVWDCHYTKSANIHHKWYPIPGVTPKFAKYIKVEVSGPTLEFVNNHDGCKL